MSIATNKTFPFNLKMQVQVGAIHLLLVLNKSTSLGADHFLTSILDLMTTLILVDRKVIILHDCFNCFWK